MDWLRWYQGTVTDPKWRLAAKDSGTRVCDVLAVWACVLEHANKADPRGSLEGWSDRLVAVQLDFGVDQVRAIREALSGEGMPLDGNLVLDWRKILVGSAKGRPPESIWSDLRRIVFKRDDYTCQYCGVRGVRLECDHVVPLSRGGPSEPDNLAAACQPCNRSKRDKTPEEWAPNG